MLEQPQHSTQLSNTISPGQVNEALQGISSLSRLLLEIPKGITTLRRKFRGEGLFQGDKAESQWIQVTKPVFVKMDVLTGKPIKELFKFPDGEVREIFVPNDEAIEEVLSMLEFAGINQISPIGVNTHDNYLDDLKEFECKLAAVLMLKQKSWGMDKELLPMYQFKIKTLVQDVRSLSVQGKVLNTLQTTVSRVEQSIEGNKIQGKGGGTSPYG